MPVPNDSFHNACIVNDCFGARAPLETIFEALAAKGIFTTDKHGNITEVDGFKVDVSPNGYSASFLSATPRRRDGVSSGGTVRLENYLTPEEIAACINEEKHRRATRKSITVS
tara:strand:- start:2656 stop:2994 length:339 start_codon:yes stop_codon:yes gene_type:complete